MEEVRSRCVAFRSEKIEAGRNAPKLRAADRAGLFIWNIQRPVPFTHAQPQSVNAFRRIPMAMDSLEALFEDTLRDMYYAEKKLTKILPKMAKKATTEELSEAFTSHAAETQGQVERLEKVFKLLDKTARAKKCEALEGLSAEGDHVMEEAEDDGVMDAGLIASAQAVEHYEIARYGTLIAWANQLAMSDAANLLSESLEEEKAADEKLSGLAESVNPMAARQEAA
jgi:ferritin-like metal-binding protein YciE